VTPALALITFLAQAEPAPPPAVAPPAPRPPPPVVTSEEPETPPIWSLGLTIGGGYRLDPAAHDAPPALGIGFSTFAGWRYLALGRHLELGLRASFSYQRFTKVVKFARMVAPGMEVQQEGDRMLSMGEFAAWQTLTGVFGRVRPWLAVGGGLGLDHFTSPEQRYEPGESRQTAGVVGGGAGFHLEVAPQTDAGLQFDYLHHFGPAFTTMAGERLHLFGDRLAVRLEMQYRF
jgi:hypothetical protein